MDFKTRDELLDFAQVLEGQTINKAIESIPDKYNEQYLQDDEARIYKIEYKGKGAFGDYLEERYFHKKNDNESQPDFPELGIELKASPLKYLQSGELTVKERLVLNHFTFKDIVNEEFNTSKFVMKNSHILLVFYIWQKASRDFGNFTINLVDIWDVLERDRNQIEADWQYIVDKVKRGEAHLLSEGDTILLGAATKGATAESSMQSQPFSDIKARGRALCFKTAYIKSIYKTLLQERSLRKKEKSLQTGKEWHPLEVVLHERLDQFFGLSGRAISKMLGKTFNLRNKSRYAHLSRYMMGLSKKESDTYHELESGNIQIKAIRIEVDGKVKESMSFRNIYFKDIVNEDWEDSLFYEELTSKFI